MSSKIGRPNNGKISNRGSKAAGGPFFIVKTKKNDDPGRFITIVVGKNVAKNATERNFLKRQVKSCYSSFVNQSRKIVVIARPGAANLTKKDVKKEITSVFKQAL